MTLGFAVKRDCCEAAGLVSDLKLKNSLRSSSFPWWTLSSSNVLLIGKLLLKSVTPVSACFFFLIPPWTILYSFFSFFSLKYIDQKSKRTVQRHDIMFRQCIRDLFTFLSPCCVCLWAHPHQKQQGAEGATIRRQWRRSRTALLKACCANEP